MSFEELFEDLRPDNKFKKRKDLFIALMNGSKSQSKIAAELGMSRSYISVFKKGLVNKLSTDDHRIQELKTANVEFLRSLAAVDIDVSEFEKILKALMEQTKWIIDEIRPDQEETFKPPWLAIKLKAMERLEKQMDIYIDKYGELSEVKAAAQFELLREKIQNITIFLAKEVPDVLPKFVEFLKVSEPVEIIEEEQIQKQ